MLSDVDTRIRWLLLKYPYKVLSVFSISIFILGIFSFMLYIRVVSPLGFFISSCSSVEESSLSVAVDIAGAINSPGVYYFQNDPRLFDVVSRAGGFTDTADMFVVSQSINLASRVKDGTKIYVPFVWDSVRMSFKDKMSSSDISMDSLSSNHSDLLNVNVASVPMLTRLNGVGERYATSILANRPYSDASDFIARSGIPKSLAEKLILKLTFD